MSTPDQIQALLANLKPRPPNSSSSSQAPILPANVRSASSASQIHQPSPQHQGAASVSSILNQPSASPITSPPLKESTSHLHTSMASPLAPGGTRPGPGAGSSDRSQSLLSLLKFSHPSGSGPTLSRNNSENLAPSQIDTGHAQGRAISASDLVARVMGNSSGTPVSRGSGLGHSSPAPGDHDSRHTDPAGSTAGDRSAALMQLLKRNSESDHPKVFVNDSAQKPAGDTGAASTASPIRLFGSAQSREATPFDPPVPDNAAASVEKESKGIFTYTNPFESLAAASRERTPQPSQSQQRASPAQMVNRKVIAPQSKMSRTSSEAAKGHDALAATDADIVPSIEDEPVQNMVDNSGEIESGDGPKKRIKKEEDELDALAEKLEDTAIEAATEMKHELDKPENKGALEEELPQPVAQAVRQVINDAAEENPEKWESMESAEDSPAGPEKVVPVYNFPIRPFVSISLQDSRPPINGFYVHDHVPIAKFSKEFDQLDRTLASSSSKFIAYCHAKNGGLRVIRQEDGADQRLFMSSKDRIFSVSFCTTAANDPATDVQALIASGVSGSTYYATLSTDGHSLFDSGILDKESLTFPPFPRGDENTSGGTLKTRARSSSRHPDFFAIGRGKAIHIIWPSTAISPKYGVSGSHREVDVEKFYSERSLKITTGKAGKDFSFSEDDTLIVSLDKVGRLRFWDIRPLVDEVNATATKIKPLDVRIPLLTLSTATPSEKTWPTSVLFVDKLRPYVKGSALRYVLVGLKQNHTLQLWDITLNKAVQEINFPHKTETDAICSVAYHPSSGIIVVGHPTRNSIYFIHLSAPRYNLPGMSQAEYIQRVATKDSSLPQPDSTACFSGIREISFKEMGQLRCLDLMPVPSDENSPKSEDEASRPLFELYITHAKGVLCRSVSKKDLGWNAKSKVVQPIDAVKAGMIVTKPLKSSSVVNEGPEVNGDSQTPPPPSSAKSSRKKSKQTPEEPQQPPEATRRTLEPQPPASRHRSRSPAVAQPSELSTADKDATRKKSKKSPKPKSSPAVQPAQAAPEPISEMAGNSDQNPVQPAVPQLATPAKSPPKPAAEKAAIQNENVSVGISGDWLDKEMKKIESMFKTVLDGQMQNLYHHTRQDRIVQDEAAQARQDAMLRVISSTLTQNVEQSLSRMITNAIQNSVIPGVANMLSANLGTRLGDHLSQQIGSQLHSLLPHQINQNLSAAITTAFQSPAISHHITQAISDRVAHKIENDITETFHNNINPTFMDLSLRAAEQNALEAERRVTELLKTYEAERQNDQTKMDKMLEKLQSLTETVTLISSSQAEFQRQILDGRTNPVQLGDGERDNGGQGGNFQTNRPMSRQAPPETPTRVQQPPPLSQSTPSHTNPEISTITQLMQDGKYEDACIRWLQSSHQDDIFDNLFAHIKPDFITGQVSPLVSFSIAVTVASNFVSNTATRLEWLNTMLGVFDISDNEINELSAHAPALVDSIISKLEVLYGQYVHRSANDPVFTMIRPTIHRAQDVRNALNGQGRHAVSQGYAHAHPQYR
ncbi:MAG: hypothetical protein Q9227_004560 [Pyrenula ochraceoflavens]